MLSRKIRKQLKQHDLAGHPECTHNWIHNAGKQCEWDCWSMGASLQGIKLQQYRKDSKRIAYMYICTMCGGEFWSSHKCFKIPHYRVREVKNNENRKNNKVRRIIKSKV